MQGGVRVPLWVYSIPFVPLALIMIVGIEAIALAGLVLVRRKVLPRLHFHDGVNDAVSGTVQAIGVFYGITVGLIAAGVWNTYSNASDLMSQEAVAIGSLYRDVSSLPEPARAELRTVVVMAVPGRQGHGFPQPRARPRSRPTSRS